MATRFGTVVFGCALALAGLVAGGVSGALAAGAGDRLDDGLVNPGYEDKPDWFKASFLDMREDLAEAASAGRRVLLYFYQDGCPYCAKLLRDNFGDRTIAAKTRAHFDVIAINMWGDRAVTDLAGGATTEKGFAAALGVQYTPTLLFLDERGRVRLRINGYYAPERFTVALDYVAGRHETAGRFRDFYAAAAPVTAGAGLNPLPVGLARPLALERRGDSGRPLLVLFERGDCRACDELHREILKRPAIATALTNLDVAQLDVRSKETLRTPDGRDSTARDWARELDIQYAPSLVFFDAAGTEVFRTEAYLRAFHVHGAIDYVVSGAYHRQPSFQRFLQRRTEALAAQGIEVELMD